MRKSTALFFVSLFLYQASNWLQNTTLNFYVYSKAGSTLSVGIVQFLQYLPLLFLPIFGGILIDKFDKYRMLLFTQFTLMTLSFLLYSVAKDDINSTLLNVFCVVVPMGILKTLDIPLRQTVMAHLVSTDKLRNATSFYSTIVNFSRFIGPFLFGITVSIFSVRSGFLISALLLIPNVFLLSLLKEHIKSGGKTPTSGNVFSAISFLLQRKDVRNIFVFVFTVGIFGWFFYVLLPEYIYKILNLPPSAYGYLTSLSGVGSVLGSLLPLALKNVYAYTLMKLGILLYAFGTSLWFASLYFYPLLGLGIFLNGFGLSLFYACANAQVQIASPRHIKGRILSLYTSIFIGSQPLSFMIGALIHRYLGIWMTLLCVILVCITLFVFMRRKSPIGTPF